MGACLFLPSFWAQHSAKNKARSFLSSTGLSSTGSQAMFCILGFSLGFLSAWYAGHQYKTHQLPNVIKNAVITGQVVSIPQWITSKEGRIIGQRFVFDIESSQQSEPSTPSKVRLNYYLSPSVNTPQTLIQQGQKWRFTAKLTPPHGFNNGVGFNYEHWLFTQNIHATGYVKKAKWLADAPAHSWAHQRLRLLEHFANNGTAGALHSALILGHKRAIPKDDYDLFVRTGTAHLFAISGLHVGMVASIGYVLGYGLVFIGCYGVGRIRQNWAMQPNLHTIGLLTAWALAGLYCMLAGFTLPTQRAFIMLSCFVLFSLIGKKAFSVNTLLISVVIVLAIEPKAIFGVGFWLSFIAVVWILYLVHICPFKHRFAKGLWIYLLLPVCLFPMNVYFFGQSATAGALANVVLIPLFSIGVMPLAIIHSIFSFLSINISMLGDVSNEIYRLIVWLLNLFDTGYTQKMHMSLVHTVFISLGICIALLPKGFTHHRGLPLMLGGALILGAHSVFAPKAVSLGHFEASVLDVGQGLAVVVRTKNHTLVYDTGNAFRTGFTVADATLVPYLTAQRIQNIDTLIVSHDDQDHRGGLDTMLKSFKVKTLLSGQPQALGLNAQACQSGQSWAWDGVEFSVLWPESGSKASSTSVKMNDNNHSCVLYIHTATHAMLITGDIEASAERYLVQQGHLPKVDALIVPHHGSNSSSTVEFLQAIQPQYALISAGAYNRFNHPHPSVIQRLKRAGAQVFTTKDCGRLDYTSEHLVCNTSR